MKLYPHTSLQMSVYCNETASCRFAPGVCHASCTSHDAAGTEKMTYVAWCRSLIQMPVLRNAAGMRLYDGFNTGVNLEHMQVCAQA